MFYIFKWWSFIEFMFDKRLSIETLMKIMLLFNIVKLITGKKTHLTPRIVIVLSVVTKKTETCK